MTTSAYKLRTHWGRLAQRTAQVLALILLVSPLAIADSLGVQSVKVAWQETHELLPDAGSLEAVTFKLRRTRDGLGAPVDGKPTIQTDVKAINRMGGSRFTVGGIEAMADALEKHLEADGLMGVTVTPRQVPVDGRPSSVDIFLVASLPLEGSRPNTNLPANLEPLATPAVAAAPVETKTWTITSARARWVDPNPVMVEAGSVLSVPVRLGERDGVYTNPEEGRRVLVESIRSYVSTGGAFDESALEAMGNAVAKHLRQQGFEEASVEVLIEREGQLLLNLMLATPDQSAPVTPAVAAEPTSTPAEPASTPAEPTTPARTPVTETRESDITTPRTTPATPTEPATETPRTEPESETTGTDVAAAAPETEETPTAEEIPEYPVPGVDGLPYAVDPFEVVYKHEHPDLPTAEEFMDLPFTLGYYDSEEGARDWIAPRPGGAMVTTTLNELNAQGGGVFWSSAIAIITSRISRVLVEDDLLGVFVIPNPEQISSTPGSIGADLRPQGDTELTILITVGRVVETRTVAQGERIPEGEEINHEVHGEIMSSSPIQPHDGTSEPTEEPRADLIRQSDLAEYIHHLNRHPGRQVEASVAAAAVPGGVSLDFLVFEPDPLTVYYEIGNTGTPQERSLRQRFGLFHSQLTGNDDILSLEYVTSNFATTNAVLGSYQFRVTDDNRIRGGVLASWNKFVNDQFGQDFVNYTGYSWSVGGQMTFNIFQDGPFFVDVVPGVNYQKVKVNNEILDESGLAGFVLPYAQLQASRQDDRGLFTAMVGLEGSPLNQNLDELTLLGRIDPANRWARMNWSASLSTFLEPLLDPVGWGDPDTPETSTLAHELSLRFSGQYSFGNRLVPQFQSVMGGLYSVRGYVQSVVAGDNAVFGSVEYRFHLPRTFAVEPEPIQFLGGDFRRAPQFVYGRPDWDLIFKGFFDAGYVFQSGNEGFEVDNTLLGAGIGLEFLYKSNLRVQLDWGFALHDLKFGLAEAGSSRLYVTGTFLW
ncbi:MAG: hypothetical protein MK116_09090 [Phycisphaerales bacterium]|nr:hypothetical protein [Phycisphaerales bacterium]